MGKQARRFKKRFKKKIEMRVKESFRNGKYCYLFMPGFEIFDILSPQMSSVEKNERINIYANLWTYEVPKIMRATRYMFATHDSFPMGTILTTPNPSYPPLSWIPTIEERIVTFVMMIALDISDDKELVGKGFYQIVEEFDKHVMTPEEFDKQYLGIGDTSGAKASPNRLRVRSTLATATKRFDFFVFNAWTKCFWYKPWLREVCREQGISYLPTVTLK